MEIIIISGRSGGGKSVALRALEDMGYYCVDNLPLDLVPQLINILSVNPWASAPAPAFRWKTWNSGSSTPPAWPVPAC